MRHKYFIPYYGLWRMIVDAVRLCDRDDPGDLKAILALVFQACLIIAFAFGIWVSVS